MRVFAVNRRRTAPAPCDLDVEPTVRDQLYGPRAEVTATDIALRVERAADRGARRTVAAEGSMKVARRFDLPL